MWQFWPCSLLLEWSKYIKYETEVRSLEHWSKQPNLSNIHSDTSVQEKKKKNQQAPWVLILKRKKSKKYKNIAELFSKST